MSNSAIRLRAEKIGYSSSSPPVLKDVDISLEQGQSAVITGKSGSGKSTLLMSLCGAIPYLDRFKMSYIDGELLACISQPFLDIQNKNTIKNLWHNSSVIFQYPDHNFIATSVLDELLMAARLADMSSLEAKNKINETIRIYHLEGIIHSKIVNLSDGTKQLVALAASYVRSPYYLFLDEPTSMLDGENTLNFLLSLKKFREESKRSIIIVTTHQPQLFENILDGIKFFKIQDQFVHEITRQGLISVCEDSAEQTIYKHHEGGRNVLCAEQLSIYYKDPDSMVVSGLTFGIQEGAKTVITGRNGAGKTTLFRTAAHLHKKYKGTLKYNTRCYRASPPDVPSEVAYVPQIPMTQFTEETVEKELMVVSRWADKTNLLDIAHPFLQSFDIDLRDDPFHLSFGQQKMVSMLCYLNYPRILLIDEPAISFDHFQMNYLNSLIDHYVNFGTTVLLATHAPQLFNNCYSFSFPC